MCDVTPPHEEGVITLDANEVVLRRLLELPSSLFTQGVPIISPWFSNTHCRRERLLWRIYLDPPSQEQDASLNIPIYTRKSFVQVIAQDELHHFKQDPFLKKAPASHTATTSPNIILQSVESCAGGDLFPKQSVKHGKYVTSLSTLEVGVVKGFSTTSFLGANALDMRLHLQVLSHRDVAAAPSLSLHGTLVMKDLLESRLLSDVKLLVEGHMLSAHRAVLAANSAVFRAMFEHDMKERSDGIVKVEGVRPAVMKAALQYMYWGREPLPSNEDFNDDKQGAGPRAKAMDLLMELLVVADRYQLAGLKTHCEEVLADNPPGDLLKLLYLADSNNATNLKTAALKTIVNHPSPGDVIDKATLQDVMANHPDLVADLLSLKFTQKEGTVDSSNQEGKRS